MIRLMQQDNKLIAIRAGGHVVLDKDVTSGVYRYYLASHVSLRLTTAIVLGAFNHTSSVRAIAAQYRLIEEHRS